MQTYSSKNKKKKQLSRGNQFRRSIIAVVNWHEVRLSASTQDCHEKVRKRHDKRQRMIYKSPVRDA